MDISFDVGRAVVDDRRVVCHLLDRHRQGVGKRGESPGAFARRTGVFQYFAGYFVKLLRVFLKCVYRVLDRRYHIFFDDPDSGKH